MSYAGLTLLDAHRPRASRIERRTEHEDAREVEREVGRGSARRQPHGPVMGAERSARRRDWLSTGR